ncbi:unnamed protein product [Symbiodinium sp. CCMP2592]|nr:unnamed protein product [Symbiodinium sp. CCMP2592]
MGDSLQPPTKADTPSMACEAADAGRSSAASSASLVAEAKIESTVNSLSVRWVLRLQAAPETHHEVVVQGELEQMNPQAPRTLNAEAGADGVAHFVGRSDFHFLRPSQRHIFRLRLLGQEEPLLRLEATTGRAGLAVPPEIARRIPAGMWQTYIGPEHELGEWLGQCPEPMVWCFHPDFALLRALWLNACFTLPEPRSPITQCPNPVSRYCLDLTKGQPWLRSKKVRRHKHDFRLTVNADYQSSFEICQAMHMELHGSTWITPGLIQSLDKCRREDSQVKVYSIELWEKSSGKLAAVIMALSVGDIFHDYTTVTVIRDGRSPGSILTKVLGHLLTQAGFTLWYWGFKNPYMAEYDASYGGVELDNAEEFWPRWRRAMALARSSDCCDLARRIAPGGGASAGGIDLATLS